ncbi:hypothetical protein L484_009126 [Morus notabilis]|uniref:Serpin domain-containing protein n=1 Tax=Morus notabilis TaxID=981085 RepID=W9RDQ6_9ROSA|nr:serpin-ZX [Morus notabilis]EXB72243.1 hypothetical protein L484_009126 [Morus notabilis]
METSTPKVFNTHFCLHLANQILEKEAGKGSKFVASPLSLHVILSLITAGSKGHTLEQPLLFLRSTSVNDLNLLSSQIISLTSPDDATQENLTRGPLLSFVNGAWLDQRFSLKPSFEEIIKYSSKAEIKNVDFLKKADEAVAEVNSWAEKATKGLIKQVLPPGSLDSRTLLVLANALYFKGSWDQNLILQGLNRETFTFSTAKPFEPLS